MPLNNFLKQETPIVILQSDNYKEFVVKLVLYGQTATSSMKSLSIHKVKHQIIERLNEEVERSLFWTEENYSSLLTAIFV